MILLTALEMLGGLIHRFAILSGWVGLLTGLSGHVDLSTALIGLVGIITTLLGRLVHHSESLDWIILQIPFSWWVLSLFRFGGVSFLTAFDMLGRFDYHSDYCNGLLHRFDFWYRSVHCSDWLDRFTVA